MIHSELVKLAFRVEEVLRTASVTLLFCDRLLVCVSSTEVLVIQGLSYCHIQELSVHKILFSRVLEHME